MADFTNLSGEALRQYYQQITALRRGPNVSPDDVEIVDRDDDWYRRRLASAAESFVVNGDLRDRDVATDPADPNATPLAQFKARLRAVLDGTATDAATILLVEATASSIYGFPVDVNNGEISARDREQLLSLQELLVDDRPFSEIFNAGAINTRMVLDADRRAQAEVELDAQLARAREAERLQGVYTIESAASALGFGTVDGRFDMLPQTFLGQPGHELDRVLVEYSEQLQRQFDGNIFDIRNRMLTADGSGGLVPTAYADQVMGYLVQNTDISDRIAELATSTDPNDIRQLQGLLRLSGVEGAAEINTSGVMDLRTMNATIAVLETPRGMGDTTLAFTVAPEGSALEHNVSPAMIIHQLENEILDDPTALTAEQMAGLPADFRERLELLRDDVDGLPALEKREMIADFLAEQENYVAYNAYLMGRTPDPELMASLRAQLPELEEAARVEATAATRVLSIDDLSTIMMSVQDWEWAGSEGVNAALVQMETALASGDAATANTIATQVITTIDADISAQELALVERNLQMFRTAGRGNDLHGTEDDNAVLLNGTPEEIVAYLKTLSDQELHEVSYNSNTNMYHTLTSGDWSRLQAARVEVDRIAGDLGIELAGRTPVDPAAAAPVVEPVLTEPEPEPEPEPVDRSVAALIAENAPYPEYLRISSELNTSVPQDLREAYNALPLSLADDREAPDALRRLAGLKRQIETGIESLETGEYTGSPDALKGQITGIQHQFMAAFDRLRLSGEDFTAVNNYLREQGFTEIPGVSFEAASLEGAPSWLDPNRTLTGAFVETPALAAAEPDVRGTPTFTPGGFAIT